MNIEDEVKVIIASALNVDVSLISDNLAIGEIPEWDSMGNLLIVSNLEEKLSIEFPLDELYELTSVEAFVQKVKELMAC